jgi:hypothetical protein
VDLEESDISAARKKIIIVRSTYWNERTKIMSNQKSGVAADSVYTSKIPWFSAANQFLVRFSNWRESHSNLVSANILYLKYTKKIVLKLSVFKKFTIFTEVKFIESLLPSMKRLRLLQSIQHTWP